MGEREGEEDQKFFFMCLCRAALPAAPAAHDTERKKDQKAKKDHPPSFPCKVNMYNLRTDGGGRAEVRYRACLPPPNQTHLYTYTSQYIDTNITNNEEKKGKKREKKEKKRGMRKKICFF